MRGSFIINKRLGGHITLEEARLVLEPHGTLSKVQYLNEQMQDMLQVPPTVLVEFTLFDPARDLHAVSSIRTCLYTRFSG